MSNRKKLFLIIIFLLLDIGLLIGYFMVREATMLSNLKKEVDSLSHLDITKDRYNREIVTDGDYAVVEGAIKDYLDSYAVLLQEVLFVMKDPEFTQILSYDNYMKDGPAFTTSLEYLKNTKEVFNQKIDTLLLNLEEDTIKNYIHDKIDDTYYQDLYKELMFSDSMKDDFSQTKELLTQTKTKVNHLIDVSTEILNFLVTSHDSWVLEEGEIRFKNQALYDQYMSYIAKIKGE